jgi:LysR family transcriptional regulator, flagellar master operon regulator
MDILLMRTFIAAADSGSFIAAAARVHASPSAVTERIKQLEHLLGARLFDRDKRGCRLTQAGQRLVEPAQAMIRAWETGRSQVTLPARYTHTVRLGGQHALWPALMIPMLDRLTTRRPDLAVRATAAAPAQLNRALADGALDMALLYDPVLRGDMRIEELAADRLVLVTSHPETDWRASYVHFDWGEGALAEIRARVGDLPPAGIELDIGVLSLDWLAINGGAGFVPERMAAQALAQGRLYRVIDQPSIRFSPYICWRASLDIALAQDLIALAQGQIGLAEPHGAPAFQPPQPNETR